MRQIWTEENKLNLWLQIEILACEALARKGIVPRKDLAKIKKRARFSVKRVAEIEKKTNHDVAAFVDCVSENVGQPAARWIHFGLTSSDLLDTTLGVQMKQSADILLEDIAALRRAVARKAKKYKMTPMIGRTHGVHAEPITFGFKLAVMFDEFGRAETRLRAARHTVSVGAISGAVGTFAHLDPSVEAYICKKLGLRPAPVSTQIIQRDVHAEFVIALALAAASIEKWATEFRHLQRTEVLEAEEYFAAGQKGSSAMPHKRNPITCERLAGLARVLRGNALAAMENISLWHERDISHSSVERVILPDSTTLLDYMLAKLTDVVDTLLVYPDAMEKNLWRTKGLFFSQSILLALTKKGVSRQSAYAWVQEAAMKTWSGTADFKTNALAHIEISKQLSAAEISKACNLSQHLRHTDAVFKRVGIGNERCT